MALAPHAACRPAHRGRRAQRGAGTNWTGCVSTPAQVRAVLANLAWNTPVDGALTIHTCYAPGNRKCPRHARAIPAPRPRHPSQKITSSPRHARASAL
eukprot:gene15790-biopygen6701